MKIITEKMDTDIIIKPEGALDIVCQENLKQEISRLLSASQAKRFVIDLSLVPFIDSACLGVFVSLAKQLKTTGQELHLACLQEEVKAIFQITRLDRLFPIVESINDLS